MPVAMSLDADVDDEVAFHVILEYSGTEPIELEFPTGNIVDIAVFESECDSEVWRWSDGKMFTHAVLRRTIEPGERLTQACAWPTPCRGRLNAIATLEPEGKVTARTRFSV